MKPYNGILIGLLTLMACNNAGRQDEQAATDSGSVTDDTYISTTPIPLDGCYRMVKGEDTANMRLNVIDSFVTGDLHYRLLGKDRNDGSVKGVIRNDLLILDYTFRSEGMMSVRQVAFKMSGTDLVEGFGDINMSGDTARFKDVNQLQFQSDRPFVKIPCQ